MLTPKPPATPPGPSMANHDEASELRHTAMPPESIIDKIGSRPLFKVRTWMAGVFYVVALILSHFFGITDANVAHWAGPDMILTVQEFLLGIWFCAQTWFTVNRKPGAVEGVLKSPKG